jgi:dienelactone hydrolase
MIPRILTATILLLPLLALADGPADNIPTNVRRVPKLGIEVPAERKAKLEAGLKGFEAKIAAIKSKGDAKVKELLPDVEVYFKAVHDALVYQEFFDPKELDAADKILAAGIERVDQLAAGQVPWASATGLVVRGYVSKIDGSVQPYGLVVPESYTNKGPGRFRCDLWFHGRGENLSELNFISDRTRNAGQITPEDTIVLHPYGRYCNANKFAGEIDVLEALDSVKKRYRIDEDRIAERGFSMGGASAWQFAVHYPDRWFAANPGAGFSETPEFLKVFQQESLQPTWWEQKLWNMYDSPGWCINLRHCPTVAYSGEIDRQKQAADVMEKALAEKHITLTHIIGPKTAHAIHAQSKVEIEDRMKSLARNGRERTPLKLDFATYTLCYNKLHWLTIDELGEHWRQSVVSAGVYQDALAKPNSPGYFITIEPGTATAFSIDFSAGETPFPIIARLDISIGDQTLETPRASTDRSFRVSVHKVGDQWRLGKRPDDGLRKRHGLQGPIDDALMDKFIFVRPTGKAWNEATGKWSVAELERAIEHWRRQFRGQAQVKDDKDIKPEDIASANLILWGDPGSNAIMKQIADKLPIKWDEKQIDAGDKRFGSDKHALIAIYPNPLNPNRYVVLNSSFTYRDYAYLNNARQVPMLPDWAVVDLTTPPNSVWPGKIADADFFDEQWKLKVSPERQNK